MSEMQNSNSSSMQRQKQNQQQSYTENKQNCAESERLYIEMKEGWL